MEVVLTFVPTENRLQLEEKWLTNPMSQMILGKKLIS